jgi:hypothetical protein
MILGLQLPPNETALGWHQGIIERYGSEPNVTYFETTIMVDNLGQRTIEE